MADVGNTPAFFEKDINSDYIRCLIIGILRTQYVMMPDSKNTATQVANMPILLPIPGQWNSCFFEKTFKIS